eukprot:322466-Prymnesium_polylepis.1
MAHLDEKPSDDASIDIRGIPAMRQQLVSARTCSHHQSCERRVEDQPISQCQQWPRSLPIVGGGGRRSCAIAAQAATTVPAQIHAIHNGIVKRMAIKSCMVSHAQAGRRAALAQTPLRRGARTLLRRQSVPRPRCGSQW